MHTQPRFLPPLLRNLWVVAAVAAALALQNVAALAADTGVPVITSASNATGAVGTAFTYQIAATNAPTSFGAAPLPAGLGFNTSTGVISGTPTAAGIFTVGISATNGSGPGTSTVTLRITGIASTTATAAPSGTLVASATDLANSNRPTFGSIAIASGSGAFSSSAAPLVDGSMYGTAGVTNTIPSLTPTNGTVVVLTFDTTLEPEGYDIAQIDVYTGTGQGRAMQNYSVAWAAPNSTTYTPLFTVTNAGTPTVSELRTRTSDLASNGAAPIATGVGSLRLTFLNTSAADPESMYREIDVFRPALPPTITSPTFAAATFDAPFSYQITATGSPLSFDASGLPAGLSLNPSTGIISGTPATTIGSPFTITLSAANAVGTGTASLALVVAKASATVTLTNLTHVYDGTVKSASATTSPSGETVNFSYSGPVLPPTNVGSYGVIGTIAPTSNYTGFASGTLVITPAAADVSLSNLSQAYTGTPRVVTASVTPVAAGVSVTYDGAASAPTAIGTYAVVATTTNPNYAGSASGTLVIATATADISLSNLSQVYTGTPRAITATATPAEAGVSITYNGSASAPTTVGSYAIVASTTNSNYVGLATGTLVITPATAFISLSNLSQAYTGTARVVTATATPAEAGVSVTYNGSATAPTAVGTYAIVATATNPNYAGSATGTLVITDSAPPVLSLPANLVAEATGPGGATVTFTATATDTVDGALGVTLSHASGSVFPLGVTTVNVSATDSSGHVTQGTFTVTVRDSTAPTFLGLTASTTSLFPVDHKMVAVTLTAATSDAVSTVTTRIVSVTANELINGPGSVAADWQITSPMTVNLRAERTSNVADRVYTITVKATDLAGNESTRSIDVIVPRKPSDGAPSPTKGPPAGR
jgi:hypothetical protein